MRRRGRAGVSWYLDETYVKVAGRWRYLYRAIDRDGQLIRSMLSEKRDKHAARRFLRRLVDVAGARPLRVTTDRHPAYPRAVRWILGRRVRHRRQQYLNNFMEQDHRGVKQRYYPMRGFGSFTSAVRFCSAFDELREFFRTRIRGAPPMSLSEQRRHFSERWRTLVAETTAAWAWLGRTNLDCRRSAPSDLTQPSARPLVEAMSAGAAAEPAVAELRPSSTLRRRRR